MGVNMITSLASTFFLFFFMWNAREPSFSMWGTISHKIYSRCASIAYEVLPNGHPPAFFSNHPTSVRKNIYIFFFTTTAVVVKIFTAGMEWKTGRGALPF